MNWVDMQFLYSANRLSPKWPWADKDRLELEAIYYSYYDSLITQGYIKKIRIEKMNTVDILTYEKTLKGRWWIFRNS